MYSTKVRFFPKKERTCHDSTVTFRLSFFNCIYVPRVTLFSKPFPCNQHTTCTFENTSLSKSKIPPTNLYCLPGVKGRCLCLSPLLHEEVLHHEICGKAFSLYRGMMKSLAADDIA